MSKLGPFQKKFINVVNFIHVLTTKF